MVAKKSEQYICQYCKDTGIMIENHGTTISTCPYCLNVQKFMEALKLAIKDSRRKGETKLSQDLQAVEAFLPHYPVMAHLEAQARLMNDNFLGLLQSAFNILSLK